MPDVSLMNFFFSTNQYNFDETLMFLFFQPQNFIFLFLFSMKCSYFLTDMKYFNAALEEYDLDGIR